MRYFILLLVYSALSCQSQKSEEYQQEDEFSIGQSDTIIYPDQFIAEKSDWNYQPLYGVYLHESNTKGFNAHLEIIPEGNDLTFSISVQRQSCSGQTSGAIGMAIHTEKEYAGFYDNADCRMEFLFTLSENTIRIQQVGFCRLLEAGCSFQGTYQKKK